MKFNPKNEYGDWTYLFNVPFRFNKRCEEYKRVLLIVKKQAQKAIPKKFWNHIRYFCNGPFIVERTEPVLIYPNMMTKKERDRITKQRGWRGAVYWKYTRLVRR